MSASHPAARCGLETALLDALCRHRAVSLWSFWGGADVRDRDTDITIPIAALERTVALAREWYRRGFRIFKTKVGIDAEEDIRRLEAVHRVFPDVAFIADANQGFTREECRMFVKGVGRFGGRILLLEQLVAKDDLDSMAALRRDTGVLIAADINIKIMKSGVLDALDIAAFARTAGLRLMIGGMVETRIAMGCSFAMVLGLGGFEFLDLDTPLLLASDPVGGGYRYAGPMLQPWTEAGLGVETDAGDVVMTIA